MAPLTVEIYSDLACPWCWIGKRRFERALERAGGSDDVRVTWRSFELNPEAVRVLEPRIPYLELLSQKYGTSPEGAQRMIDTMAETAAGEGLTMRLERARPGNTFDAHRVVHHAAERGLADAAKERLFRAYLSEGEPLGDRDVLVRLAGEIGLDAGEVGAMLEGDDHAATVRADEDRARSLRIGGVPFFVVGGRYGLSGAQPAEVLAQFLTQAREELRSEAPPDVAGEACGPDGCD
jgi:predicted DsbA family dithiol-disulfide isomerase